MSYLLPAGAAPRTKNKWGLGLMVAPRPYSNGGTPPMPGPMPVFNPNPTAAPVFPTPPSVRPQPPIRIVGPITYTPPPTAPSTPTSPSTSGTPVPAGFPTNQFYVAPDGSVWEYSVSSNSWFNTGTPYNVNAPGGGATAPTPAATTDSGASQAPVSVTVSTPASESGYQSILDWLTQQTLISGLPNWTILAAGAVAYKMFFASGSSGRGRQ